MNNLEKSIKKKYILFLATIMLIIISVLIIIQKSVNNQNQDAYLINKSGKQRMLSQRIAKIVFSLERTQDVNLYSLDSLKIAVNELENSHNYLHSENRRKENNPTVDSLLKIAEPYLKKISTSSRSIINHPNSALINQEVEIIAEAEPSYMLAMNTVTDEYQNGLQKKLQYFIRTIYFLALLAALILIGEYLFVLMPALKLMFQQNNQLTKANDELAKSENRIKENVLELIKLKTDLEVKDTYNKVFIEQAPTAISMLDNNMCYIAVSQQWIADYKMEGQEIIGRSHYDLFPEIGQDWKENHQKCLNGAIDICDEAPFKRADGSVQWIYWDVRPWYISENNIGGLIMHTGDLTLIKEKEDERIRIEKILNKTNEVARIGTWDIDLIKNELFWSKMVHEIHEVPDDFVPDLATAIHFFKEGKSRETIEKVVNEAIEHGTPYDVEIELITFKGNVLWTRAIGQAEFVDGTCVRLFGVFQDVNDKKLSQLALSKAHTELKAIFNSEAVAIVATEVDGIISHFNRGAEVLTGYSASEMIGLQRPTFFHLQEEFDKFRIDIAKQYNKNPIGFSAQEELSKHNAYDTREWHYRKKDGSTIPVQLTLTSIKDEQDKLIGFLGISTDISDRKKMESELLRKNQLLNIAEKISMIGNWQVDVVNNSEKWSANLYNIFGIEEDARITTDTFLSFVHPEDKERVAKHVEKSIKDKEFSNLVFRIQTKDGTIKTVQNLAKIVTDNKGNVVEMIGTCQDITTIQAFERELYEANLQLRAIFNSGPIAIVSTNNDGIINHFNSGAETLLGYAASEMIGLNPPEIFHIEEELDKFRIDIAKKYEASPHGFDPYLELANRNEHDTREWTYRRKDGSTFPVELTLTAIKNDEGKKIGFLGVSFDITERKKTKDELLRKNQLLSFAEKITMMGNWQWDLVTNNVKWSANLYNIFGIEEGTPITYNTYFSFVHPDDKEKVTEHVQKSIENKKFIDLMHRIKLTNGGVKTIQLLAEIITDNKGDVIEMVGTCQDVTAQRMAENKFRGLLESAPDAMVIMNEKEKIQLINKQAEKLFGYNADELFGKSVEILIPKRFTGTHATHRDGFFSNPKTRAMGQEKELYGKNKTGLKIPIQISVSPLQTEEGLLVSVAIRDITEEKLSERKIIEAKENLEALANKLTTQNTKLANFAHITSHNLRAPVINLNSLLDFYNDSNSEEAKIELFKKFENVIHHLTLTLNTLVETLKTKNVNFQDNEDLSFDEVLTVTKEILYGKIKETGAIITSDFSKLKTIHYNKIYLESIFLNLLGNAIKYRSEDRTPEIFIESNIEEGKMKLKFKDNGMGIDLKRHAHKLFGLNKVFHKHPEAQGVGLFITKAQIEAMGGEISATSKVDEGSTFTIDFN